MEKKFFRKMRKSASKSGTRLRLAIEFRGLALIFRAAENQWRESSNDPDFRGKWVSVWVEEIKEKRAKYEIRNILEMDFGRYSPDFVPRYRRFGE